MTPPALSVSNHVTPAASAVWTGAATPSTARHSGLPSVVNSVTALPAGRALSLCHFSSHLVATVAKITACTRPL